MTEAAEFHRRHRPLWRRIADFPLVALVIAILLFATAVALGLALDRFVPQLGRDGRATANAAINIALVVAVYKLVIARLGECPRDDLPAKDALRNLAIGMAVGIAIFSAIVGAAALAGVYRIVGPGDTSTLLLELVGTAIIPGFMEELLFRGILLRWIEDFAGSWAGLLLTSALFGLAHIMNPNATWFSSFAIAMEAGVLLGGAYLLTRSLWMPMGLHAAWNFTQGEIFDVPVSGLDEHGLVQAKLSGPAILSGGNFGLEASVIAMVIATAAGIWMVWRAVIRGQLVQPWWVRRRIARAAA